MGGKAGKMDEVPKTLNCKSMRRLLEANGWKKTEGGKHSVKMDKDGCRPITLPIHRGQDYGKDLRARILREAGLK